MIEISSKYEISHNVIGQVESIDDGNNYCQNEAGIKLSEKQVKNLMASHTKNLSS